MRRTVARLREWLHKDKDADAGARFAPNVSLGKSVSIAENVTIYRTAPVTIGDHTMIGLNVIIHTSTHDYDRHPMWSLRIDRPVHIGQHVWIGAGAIVLPGVRVGSYSVVAAGSVVTAHVPPGAIVAGNPARIIRQRALDTILKEHKLVEDYPLGAQVVSGGFLDDSRQCKPLNEKGDNQTSADF